MKINEPIQDFTTQASNEEKAILSKLKEVKRLDHFVERDQEVIHNLIRKSLVRKIPKEDYTLVVANGHFKTR